MVSTLSSFQTHIASIMETLVQTAVLEISRLVDVEFEVLLSEVTRSRSEISELKKRLSLTEVQPWTNTGQTLTQSFTGVKSEYAQEEMHNHLKRCSVEVLFRDSPTVIQQDQDSPQQKYEVSQPISMIKQEIHEVDVWIGQDKEAETHCDEAISMSTTKDVLETVPCVDRNREHAAARVLSKSEPLELNRNDLPGEMMVQSLSMKCTYESENPSFSHTQSLSASKSTRTSSDNTISWDKRLVCTYCSKWFKCFSQLKIHQRSHTGEKPYRCTLCGKQYIQKGHLYTHQRTHTGEKPYRCAVCGKGFIQKCTLDMHLRSHTGEKPYTCIKCGKGFTTKFNLNKHLSCLSCNSIS